jgi:hypothetical protein
MLCRDIYCAVTFIAEAIRTKKYLTPITPAKVRRDHTLEWVRPDSLNGINGAAISCWSWAPRSESGESVERRTLWTALCRMCNVIVRTDQDVSCLACDDLGRMTTGQMIHEPAAEMATSYPSGFLPLVSVFSGLTLSSAPELKNVSRRGTICGFLEDAR